MKPITIGDATLHMGDCIEQMRGMADASVDSIVTDPPYELTSARPGGRSPATEGKVMKGFMGMQWDGSGIAYSVEMWTEALRVLKPGGHLLAFSGSRTYHRMVCAIEDAGFEIRDQIMWVYGSGFPKSLDVSKAIDKARDDRGDILRVTTFMADAADRAGITRADVDAALGTSDMGGWWLSRLLHRCQCPKWDQWLQIKILLSLGDDMDAEVWRLNGRKGTPGNERPDREVSAPAGNDVFQPTQRVIDAGTPVLDAARQWQGWGTALKPAHEPICVARKQLIGTVAANVLAHGTGALNIDGCRVDGGARPLREVAPMRDDYEYSGNALAGRVDGTLQSSKAIGETTIGRWPANLIHDGSEEVLAAFPQSASGSGGRSSEATAKGFSTVGCGPKDIGGFTPHADAGTGSAARFFYTAKADAEDRHEGIPGTAKAHGRNHHPTVKPADLMRYLCRLVTPPGGLVLDPFMGSGSTGKAAVLEGFRFIGIDLHADHVEIAAKRIEHARRQGHQPSFIFNDDAIEKSDARPPIGAQ